MSMKFLAALALALPLSSFAANYAACDLYAFTYSSSDWRNYTLVKSERLSNKWEKLANSDVVLNDSVYPVSYSVKFSLDGSISGSLDLKIDQPGPSVQGSATIFDYLNLELEDLYNGGKTVYKLECGLDS